MKKIFTLLLLGAMISPSFAQDEANEKKAKEILDVLSTEAKTFKTLEIDFEITVKGKDINTTQKGKAKSKGTKFFYETEDRKVYSDGKAVWTYLTEEEECYIDNLEDMEGGMNPSELMTIWENNFKFQYVKETSTDVHVIKLFPKDVKTSKYHTVILTVNTKTKRVTKAIIKTKENVTIMVKFKTIKPNTEINDNVFKWNSAQHGNPDEIDNR